MNMLDRYVNEVGKHLPFRARADIEAEIRSTLNDMLEDRSRKAGRPVDDAMTAEVLKEYGAPEKVAASYTPDRYLIGPQLYPFFRMVLRIVFSVLTVLALVGLGIDLSKIEHMTSAVFIQALGNFALQYGGGAIQAFGNIVLVFAILQWTQPADAFVDKDHEEWDPAMLAKEPDPDETPTWELLAGMGFTLAAILIFNLYPQLLGIYFESNGKWVSIPFLSGAFFHFLPWITGIWALQLVRDAILLRQGRWTTAMRWYALAIKVLSIVLAGALLAAPSLLGITPETLVSAAAFQREAADTLIGLLNTLVRLALVLAIVLEGVEIARSIYRMFSRRATALPIG